MRETKKKDEKRHQQSYAHTHTLTHRTFECRHFAGKNSKMMAFVFDSMKIKLPKEISIFTRISNHFDWNIDRSSSDMSVVRGAPARDCIFVKWILNLKSAKRINLWILSVSDVCCGCKYASFVIVFPAMETMASTSVVTATARTIPLLSFCVIQSRSQASCTHNPQVMPPSISVCSIAAYYGWWRTRIEIDAQKRKKNI